MASQANTPWRNNPPGRNGPQERTHNPRKRPAETQEAAWVADEDRFVLQQAKKKAEVRVKEGRAKPIDWLAVTLRFVDPSRNLLEDEVPDAELHVVDPEGVFEGLEDEKLAELEKDIDVYITLEANEHNKDFWETMHTICKDRRQKARAANRDGRGVDVVSDNVDRLFNSKSLEELENLEKQILTKLRSNETIDVDYWESLLRTLMSWKAKAKLRKVSNSIVQSQLQGLRTHQADEARSVASKLSSVLGAPRAVSKGANFANPGHVNPEALLKIRPEDKDLGIQDEAAFLAQIVKNRKRILKLGYVPASRGADAGPQSQQPARDNTFQRPSAKVEQIRSDDFSQASSALYEREVARGVGQDEEIFTGEEEVSSVGKHQWKDKYRPRKPKYFNRVQMGYEWNKYNQTHYDHDNPPPKVVQGYKFNIFYPDLIDRTRAPTYKVERENGRKKGQSFAPAGEEDTCLIRFIAGPPYEDVAFRIVDKEWDYSAKRERGFKSSYDKGILQLHFQFKKIFYRK